MAQFEETSLDPLVDKIRSAVDDAVFADLAEFLLQDTESNLQAHIHSIVGGTIRALLSGDKWAMQRYVLNDAYDAPKIRAAVAKHLGPELRDRVMEDLIKEVSDLREKFAWAHR